MNGDSECDGSPSTKCKSLRRVTTLLRYHHHLMASALNNPATIFTNFCDETYPPRTATNDYIHYVQKHSDNESRRQIAKELDLKCLDIGQCAGSLRHYGQSESVTVSDGLRRQFMMRQFDTLHFNLCHVEEAGFRLKADDLVDDGKVAEDEVVDSAMNIVTERVKTLKKHFDSERLNGGTNSKFNISVQTGSETQNKGILYFRNLLHFQFSLCSKLVIFELKLGGFEVNLSDFEVILGDFEVDLSDFEVNFFFFILVLSIF